MDSHEKVGIDDEMDGDQGVAGKAHAHPELGVGTHMMLSTTSLANRCPTSFGSKPMNGTDDATWSGPNPTRGQNVFGLLGASMAHR